MHRFTVSRIGIACAGGVAAALACGRIAAVPRHGGEHRAPRAESVTFTLPAEPPKGAVVLFSGKADEIKSNFYTRYTENPANWTVDDQGVATPAHSDITSKREFGDAIVHAEFKEPANPDGTPKGGGNSGVGLQGRYEIQILNSFGKQPEAHECGALYSQKPPIVIASKKAGEWQTYDIVFRAPRFDAAGQVTEKPRATVFQNGILIQNNEEFTGMTGIQYGQYKEMTKTGPVILQGDHDTVQFRNVWVVPL